MYTLLCAALAWGQPPGNASVLCTTHATGLFPPCAPAPSVPPHICTTTMVDACACVYDDSVAALHPSLHMASPPGIFTSRFSFSNTSSNTSSNMRALVPAHYNFQLRILCDTLSFADYDFQFFAYSSLRNWLCRMLFVLDLIGVYQAFASMPPTVRFYGGSKPPAVPPRILERVAARRHRLHARAKERTKARRKHLFDAALGSSRRDVRRQASHCERSLSATVIRGGRLHFHYEPLWYEGILQ